MPTVPEMVISPAHPHFRWRGCLVLRHGHGTTSAAVCRGMPFCPCYSRVDLRPRPGLVLLLCWRENPRQPGTSAPAGGSRRSQPDGDSRRNAAHRRTRRRRTTRRLSKHQRAQQAPLLHASTGRPSGTLCPLPIILQAAPVTLRPEARLRTATRNACSASQSHAERIGANEGRTEGVGRRAQIPRFWRPWLFT